MRARVKNAADPKQVAYGTKQEQRAEQLARELLRDQLSTPRGREYVWSQLEGLGIFDRLLGRMEDVYAQTAVGNVGRLLYARLIHEHGEAFLLMQTEAIQRLSQQNRSIAQAHEQLAQTGDE